MYHPNFVFFFLFALSFSFQLRDIVIGEWDVFPADSDFTQTSYTIEFHQSSYDPINQNIINCTLWKDESMHSYLPSAFIFNAQGPLAASLQISFNSDYSGSIFNIKTRNFNHDSNLNEKLCADFTFEEKPENGNKRISRFKIDKYTFVIDLSRFNKDGQLVVEVSSSIDDKDSSLISSKKKYIVARTKEFENKQFIKQKQSSKLKSNSNEFSHDTIDIKITNKIKDFLNKMEIDIPNNYAILIIALLFMFIIFLISKIVSACFFTSEVKKSTKATTGKKAKKHKKKNSALENKKEEAKTTNETEIKNDDIEKATENKEKKDDGEEVSKIKTD